MKNVPVAVLKDWKNGSDDTFATILKCMEEEESGALQALLNLCSVSSDAEVRGAHGRWQQINSATRRMRDPK